MSIDKIELCGAVLSKELKSFIDKESKVWVHLIGEYFPKTIFFYHSYWYHFKEIKGHAVLVIDCYKYGGSEKTSKVKFA